MSWTTEQKPDLTGARALVTGGSGGLGQQVALELSRHGAAGVILAARNDERLAASVAGIRASVPTPACAPSASTWPTCHRCAGRPRRCSTRTSRSTCCSPTRG